jgi:drug/metabolite transporter (DMT)-like permease
MKPGIMAALGAAALFGAGTPFAKLLLGQTNPWMLAALLYLGSGAGLWLMRMARRSPRAQLTRQELAWMAGAVVAGGMVGPVLLMTGLAHMPASGAALLLNMEGVLTALIAWLVFRENVDRRIALGMACIVAGSVALSWPADGLSGLTPAVLWPALAVLAACLAWAVDNNLTRKVSLNDASWIAMVKGLAAGGTNLALALALGPATELPAWHVVLAAGALGFASYGASLALFVVGLRHLGTARTGAYFSIAPFFGAVLAFWLLKEPVTAQWLAAGALMAVGLALHLTEQHTHPHQHEPLEHSHLHSHGPDEIHHQHGHGPEQPITDPHVHWHRHDPVTHSHSHYPDAHHQHRHP